MRESMGFAEGMLVGLSKPRHEGGVRQMDWDVLHQLIEVEKSKGLVSVEAGLLTDWDCTAGEVWREGRFIPPTETYTFTSSVWATPAAIFIYADGREVEHQIWKYGGNAKDYFKQG